MVVVTSENLSAATYAGPGAGRFPTANSVVSDLLRLAGGKSSDPFPLESDAIQINNDYEARFYIRINCSDGIGIIKSVGRYFIYLYLTFISFFISSFCFLLCCIFTRLQARQLPGPMFLFTLSCRTRLPILGI